MKMCPHHIQHGLNYLQWQDYAKEHQKKYGKQKQCEACGRWFWPDEVGPEPGLKKVKEE